MSTYTPTQGVIVNGRVADADDIMNELGLIATALQGTNDESEDRDIDNLAEAKTYTDTELAAYDVDGGTF